MICLLRVWICLKRQIIWFNSPYSANVKTNVGKIFMRLFDKHFPRHHKYYKLFNRNNIKLSYNLCLTWTMSSGNIFLKLWKIQHHLPPKLATAVEKQIVLWMVTVFLNALFTKHLSVQLLINITMVLVKILS